MKPLLSFNSLHSKYFTRHGQHLNKLGKKALSTMIVNSINLLRNKIDFYEYLCTQESKATR